MQPQQRRENTVVIDERNMLRIWLDEKVALRQMSPTQADEEIKRYETQAISPSGLVANVIGFEDS